MAWNLRNGFSDYLAARDTERLEQFVTLVEESAEQAGGRDAFAQQRLDMRELLEAFAQREGLQPQRPPPPREGQRPRPPAAAPPLPAEAFGRRVALYDNAGKPLLGRPLPRDAGPFIERPVHLQGEVVGQARMLRNQPVPDAVETRFLRSQYRSIAFMAAALLLLVLAFAWWWAARWVRPLVAIQDATRRIARGELNVRLRIQRSDEIGDVVRNVNRMAEDLQALEGSRRRWIADISHELRTPLTVLRGEIEAIRDGVRALRPEAMASLHEEVLRISALVDDLHLLALSDLKVLPCHPTDADAVQIVQSLVQRFATRAASRGLTLKCDLGSLSRLPVWWDAARISQLVANLLENSLRYTDAPGEVLITLRSVAARVSIAIDDSAPGVPAMDMARLFEPLYRAEAARDRHSGGSGLGLAICDAIAKAHGGRITASASGFGGLRLSIELPQTAKGPA
jgi:two-component system sensor histidine kinase BaeS